MTTKYIYKWEGDKTQPHDDEFTWRGGKIIAPSKTSFGVGRVIAETGDRQDYYDTVVLRAEAIKRNAARISNRTIKGAIGENPVGDILIAINGDLLEDVPASEDYSGNFNLSLNFYVDGTLRFTKDVYATDVPFRLTARDDNGKALRGRIFEVEITGNVPVQKIDIASAMEELSALPGQGG